MPGPFNNETFASEADELLPQIESATLALEADASDAENINLLFRALHTFKGSAAIVGLDAIASFAHHVYGMPKEATKLGGVDVELPLERIAVEIMRHAH